MRTVAVMNNKGGVGKTVAAVALADILTREHRKRVILADCDGQMNASRLLAPDLFRGPGGPDGCVTLRDLLTGDGEPYWWDNLLEVPGWEGLSLIPGTPDLYALDVDTVTAGPNRALRLDALREYRNAVEADGEADFLLFDCPPGFTSSSCGFYLLSVFRGGEAARAVLLDEEAEGGRFVLSRACALLFLKELSGLSSFQLEANCKAIGF